MKKTIILSFCLLVLASVIGINPKISAAQNKSNGIDLPEKNEGVFTIQNKTGHNIQVSIRYGPDKKDVDSKTIGSGLEEKMHCPYETSEIYITYVWKNREIKKTLRRIVIPGEKIKISKSDLKLTKDEKGYYFR